MKTLNILIFILVFAFSTSLFAQQRGQITGTVVDAESGETIIGASIFIEGTSKGAASDIDGNYTIRSVDPGTYVLVVSYISYSTQRITNVVLENGQVLKLDIALQPETELLGEITVTAEAVLNNEAGLLRQRQKSIAFSDAISAETISKTGSGDAAGALKKVVGASVVGGKYVYVRGLGDRYSTAHLNGAELPSADPDNNAFQLDLIPSNVIENIVTIKTFTPDKPGNFSGGLVDVSTKDFPERLLFNISTSVGYNTQSTFEDGLSSLKSDTDLLGFDNGFRDLPDYAASTIGNTPEYAEAFIKGFGSHDGRADTLDQLSRSFSSEMVPRNITVPLNTGLSISVGNRAQLGEREIGYILGFSHNRSLTSYSDGDNAFYGLIGNLSPDIELNAETELNDYRTTDNIDLGGLASLNFKLNPTNKFSFTWLRTQSATNEGRWLNGFKEENFDGGFDSYNSNVISYTERKLSSFQLAGNHVFTSLSNLEIDWSATSSVNELNQPDTRFFEYGINTEDVSYSISRSFFSRPQHFFRELDENNTNVLANLTLPLEFGSGLKPRIKLGGNMLRGDREFRELRFAYEQDRADLNGLNGDFEAFFSYVGIDQALTDASSFYIYGNYIIDRTNPDNDYDGEREIDASYIMAEVPIGNFTLIGGARYEGTYIRVENLNEEAPDSLRIGLIDRNDLLPAVSVVYNITDNQNLRVAYSNTLARPNYRELAPFSSFDAYGGITNEGNPNLDRTLIYNYDIRYEWFLGVGEVIAVSSFYKRLDSPIERVFDVFRQRTRTWQNVDEAQVYGVEFEVRKNLGFLADALQNFSLASNITFVHSNVDIPEDELVVTRASDPDPETSRPLNGQSPHIFNLDLSYFNPDNDLTVDLNTNYFGDRLSDVTLGANPDIFERGYVTTDLIIGKGFVSNYSMKLSLRNLFDPKIKRSSELNGDEYIFSAYRNGRSISLSVSYKL